MSDAAPALVNRANSLALKLRDVQARFGSFVALDGINLEVRAGEVIGICGENGAGKTTLVRLVAGDLVPAAGEVQAFEHPVGEVARSSSEGIAVVWQDLSLCDNLDVAANVMLGREPNFFLGGGAGIHKRTSALIEELRIPLPGTTTSVRSLSGGQRQLVAIARAMRDRPRLLVLDEPTGSLGVNEGFEVERLILRLREQGVTILLVSHDVEQLFRLTDRIVVLRSGRLVGDVDPGLAHFDEVVALMAGQQLDSSPRGQLSRLHGLVERLASTDRSSSLSLIISTLGAALRVDRVVLHVLERDQLRCAASLGLSHELLTAWRSLPVGESGGPVGTAAEKRAEIVDPDVRSSPNWERYRHLAAREGIASSWSVPIIGSDGVAGVISVLRAHAGEPERDELDLTSLYTGYAASALERERLFGEVTVRNSVLETIREVLETLAGPIPVDDALTISLRALCDGVGADEVALVSAGEDAGVVARAAAMRAGGGGDVPSAMLLDAVAGILSDKSRDGQVQRIRDRTGANFVAVSFSAPEGHAALVARFANRLPVMDPDDLMSDASHSFRLALEREEVGLAHQEASALRRSRELQQRFLSRLSHELRTPLTAIRGYASSLLQDDVTWDRDSERRFLSRMASESARLGRLVNDLLDYSAIESGVMRLQPDWCNLALVLEAAVACLPASSIELVDLTYDDDLPVVWADHDRLEQLFVNLLENASRHNPSGTMIRVAATLEGSSVVVDVADNGTGIPREVAASLFEPGRRRVAPTAGTGLGLSIAKAIADAHGGTIELLPEAVGTHFRIRLPIEAGAGPLDELADA